MIARIRAWTGAYLALLQHWWRPGSEGEFYTVLSNLASTSPTVFAAGLSRLPKAVGSIIHCTRSELLTGTRHLPYAKQTARHTIDKQVIAKASDQIGPPAGILALASWETSPPRAQAG